MRDVLLVIDVLNDFRHEDGPQLLASVRERLPAARDALERARKARVPVVYVNDHRAWVSDRAALVRGALDGPGGDAVAELAPRHDEPLLLKARYSAFDQMVEVNRMTAPADMRWKLVDRKTGAGNHAATVPR